MNSRFCPKCGSKQEGNNFCTNCGNKLYVDNKVNMLASDLENIFEETNNEILDKAEVNPVEEVSIKESKIISAPKSKDETKTNSKDSLTNPKKNTSKSSASSIFKSLIIVFAYNLLSSAIIFSIIPKEILRSYDFVGSFTVITLFIILPSLIISIITKFLSKGKYTFSKVFLYLSLIGITILLAERILAWGI